jgi:hypothetical protein
MQESSTARPSRSRGDRIRQRLAMTLAGLALAVATGGACQAQDSIYRCTAPDGSIEFRQYPCHGRDRAEEVELGPDTQGWEPPPEVKRPAQTTTKRKTRDPAKRAREEKKQEERCWKKRKQLDKVRHRLRSGYKAGQGQKLRRQRDEHQDYIKQFCR